MSEQSFSGSVEQVAGRDIYNLHERPRAARTLNDLPSPELQELRQREALKLRHAKVAMVLNVPFVVFCLASLFAFWAALEIIQNISHPEQMRFPFWLPLAVVVPVVFWMQIVLGQKRAIALEIRRRVRHIDSILRTRVD